MRLGWINWYNRAIIRVIMWWKKGIWKNNYIIYSLRRFEKCGRVIATVFKRVFISTKKKVKIVENNGFPFTYAVQKHKKMKKSWEFETREWSIRKSTSGIDLCDRLDSKCTDSGSNVKSEIFRNRQLFEFFAR